MTFVTWSCSGPEVVRRTLQVLNINQQDLDAGRFRLMFVVIRTWHIDPQYSLFVSVSERPGALGIRGITSINIPEEFRVT